MQQRTTRKGGAQTPAPQLAPVGWKCQRFMTQLHPLTKPLCYYSSEGAGDTSSQIRAPFSIRGAQHTRWGCLQAPLLEQTRGPLRITPTSLTS